MDTPLASLDDFLDGPHQRGLTRAVRTRIAKGHGLVLVYGNGPAAERFVATLARTHPDDRAHLALIESGPVRLTLQPQAPSPDAIDVGDSTPDQLVRAMLRQDPDAIAMARLEGCDPKLLLSALFTGHQLLVGSSAATLDAALAALCVGSDGLDGHVRASLDLACELDGSGRLRRVLEGDGRGSVTEVAVDAPASVPAAAGASMADTPSLEPRTPRFAPPLASRPAATLLPRAAFLPQTSPGVTGRSLLGTRVAHRPHAAPWPACRDCGAPMALVIQIDLAQLPDPLPASDGLAQLFVCPVGGCDVENERSIGVLAEVIDGRGVTTVEAPASLEVEVVEPGTITAWRRFDEDPVPEDLVRAGLERPRTLDDDVRPLRSDKLGGWPAWEQGLDWPEDEGGPYELLFQFAEGAVLAGGTPDTWDDATATRIPGTPPEKLLDPEAPCHFPSLLTAEAVAFLFRQPATGRLAFRWQTG